MNNLNPRRFKIDDCKFNQSKLNFGHQAKSLSPNP